MVSLSIFTLGAWLRGNSRPGRLRICQPCRCKSCRAYHFLTQHSGGIYGMLKARMLVESLLDEPKETLARDKIVKEQVCPHCGDVIHEKGTYYENDIFRHRTCGGALLSAQPSEETIAWMKSGFGMDYDPATRKFTPQEQNRS